MKPLELGHKSFDIVPFLDVDECIDTVHNFYNYPKT